MNKKLLALTFSILIGCSLYSQVVTFNYTGSVQTYTVPACATQIVIDVRGGQGEANPSNLSLGGNGGRVQATMNVVPGQVLQVYVGGGGAVSQPGGWPNGGAGGLSYQDWPQWQPSPACPGADGGGGGGSSDIRVAPYAPANIVALGAGGGGTGGNRIQGCGPGAGGGGGGGYYGGGGGGGYSGSPGLGGSQVAGGIAGTSPGCAIFGGLAGTNGSFWQGGAGGGAPGNNQFGSANGCAGGCGGTLVGAAGNDCTGDNCPGTWSGGSGGGGSNYAAPVLIGVTQAACFQAGNGQVIITAAGSSLAVTAAVVANEPCGGDCVGIATCTASGGNPAYTYSWAPSGGNGTQATGLCAGQYTITVHDAQGCFVTDSVIITQPPVITIAPAITNASCGLNNAIVNANVSGGTPGYNYSWSPGGSVNAIESNLSAGTYTINVTDSKGCTMSATAVVTAAPALSETTSTVPAGCGGANGSATITVTGGTPGYIYSWLPVGGTNATASNLSAASYTVNVKDAAGCTISASVSVSNANSETVSIANVSNVSCFGGNNGMIQTNTFGGAPPYTYLWSPSGGTNATASNLAVGTYTITVHDAIGCISTASATITQPPLLTVGIGGIVNVFCIGDSNGSAIATPGGGTPPYRYQWSPLGGTGAAGIGLKYGIDTVVVEDAQGCTVTSTVTITGNPSPVVVFSAYPLAGCGPTLCTNFKDLSTVAAGFIKSWYWTFGDDTVDTLQNPHHCYDKTGFYSVSLKVTGSNGCSATLSKLNLIDVYTSPVAAFSFGPQPTTILDPVISFTDQTKDQYGIASWFWSYGDGSDSLDTKQNPSHRYADTGRYCARLIVTNKRGCVDTTTECLVISPPFALYVPSGFSPNADGINDIFLPRGEGIAQYSLYIFNRWGNMIFHTTDIDKGWDGSSGGTICQQDTYIYLIDVTDIFGKAHSYLGRVTLIQ